MKIDTDDVIIAISGLVVGISLYYLFWSAVRERAYKSGLRGEELKSATRSYIAHKLKI